MMMNGEGPDHKYDHNEMRCEMKRKGQLEKLVTGQVSSDILSQIKVQIIE